MVKIYDVLIIGGGPAGLYSSFYAGLRDLSVCLLEAKEALGGKINFYPEKLVWDVGALPPTKGKKVKEYIINQALIFKPSVHTGIKIVDLQQNESIFSAIDACGNKYQGRSVLIASGSGIYSPKKLSCNISNHVKNYIHYQFPNQATIKGKHLVISGGGDSAVDYALEAINYAAKVTLCYRGNDLKAHEAQVKKIKELGVKVLTKSTIISIEKGVEKNNLSLALDNHQTTLLCDHLLVQHGYDCGFNLLEKFPFQIDKHENFYVKCHIPTKTSCQGIFVAGDCHYCDGKVNLLAGAFHDAIQAVNQIKYFLSPLNQEQAMVSSHNKKFDEMNLALLRGDVD